MKIYFTSLVAALLTMVVPAKHGKNGGRSSIVFYEDADGDYVENGDATSLGDLTLWHGSKISNEDEEAIGNTVGHCVTVAEDPVIYFCIYNVVFTAGEYVGSTLTFQGEYPDYGEDTFRIQTITGGTGAFTGVSGRVHQGAKNSGLHFRMLQS
jgi:hypothetical protein